MSYAVFWLDADGQAGHQVFDDAQLDAAMGLCKTQREAGMRHVCISPEPGNSVGKSGVDTVADGHLPSGDPYEWSKAGRAGATRRSRR